MNYIIDSDILIYFIKGQRDVVEKLINIPPQNLFTTRINYTELFYGAYNSTRIKENLETVSGLLDRFQILEFDKNSSEIFAKVKANLKQNGNIIADMDLMIASISISNNYILVTNNIKHFERIKNLKIEKWIEK